MLLVLEHFFPQLVPLLQQQFLLFLQLLVVALVDLPRQVLLYLVGKVLVQVLRHLQLFLHDLQLVLQRLVQTLVLYVLRLETAVTVAGRVVLAVGTHPRTVQVPQQRTDTHIVYAQVVPTLVLGQLPPRPRVGRVLFQAIALERPCLGLGEGRLSIRQIVVGEGNAVLSLHLVYFVFQPLNRLIFVLELDSHILELGFQVAHLPVHTGLAALGDEEPR